MTDRICLNRRSFLATILASAVAPAIVRADSLMRIVPRETLVVIPRALPLEVWASCGVVSMSIEQELETITAQAIGANARELYTLNFRHTATEVNIELPPTIAQPRSLRLDGRDAPLPEGAVVMQNPTGVRVLHIPRLDLTEYGNRVPQIEVGG